MGRSMSVSRDPTAALRGPTSSSSSSISSKLSCISSSMMPAFSISRAISRVEWDTSGTRSILGQGQGRERVSVGPRSAAKMEPSTGGRDHALRPAFPCPRTPPSPSLRQRSSARPPRRATLLWARVGRVKTAAPSTRRPRRETRWIRGPAAERTGLRLDLHHHAVHLRLGHHDAVLCLPGLGLRPSRPVSAAPPRLHGPGTHQLLRKRLDGRQFPLPGAECGRGAVSGNGPAPRCGPARPRTFFASFFTSGLILFSSRSISAPSRRERAVSRSGDAASSTELLPRICRSIWRISFRKFCFQALACSCGSSRFPNPNMDATGKHWIRLLVSWHTPGASAKADPSPPDLCTPWSLSSLRRPSTAPLPW